MVRIRYTGVSNPEGTFGRYRAWRTELTTLRGNCTPLGPDYKALDGLIKALDVTAAHFTGDAHFYQPEYRHPSFQYHREE